MIDSRHELLSFYILCNLLLLPNLSNPNNSEVTLLFLIIFLILMIAQYQRSMTYLKQLKRYDEVAAAIQEHKDWSSISPLVIEQQEILGIQYNKLMRFIQKQEFRNRRNMQIISIITNSIQDPMVILNVNGDLEYANNRFKEWVNLSALKTVSFQNVKNEQLRKILEDA
ncbi:MAG: two-component sensor histidine kinase, partial [Turicibacter sp.]|nr:two-component sensor histidine kinase [Turicibacter sp.]